MNAGRISPPHGNYRLLSLLSLWPARAQRPRPGASDRPDKPRFSIRFWLAAVFAALLGLSSAPAWAAGQLTATPSTCASYSGDILHVNVSPCTISMTTAGATTTTDTIAVNAVPANVTLDNVSIDVSGMPGYVAFEMPPSTTVNLTLVGTNTLKSGNLRAGVHAPAGFTLTIGGTGSLTAIGGNAGAGIGGNVNDTGGTITINSGTVTAIGGGSGAAGIGGGGENGGAGGTIVINGGTVTATGSIGGGGGASGIGGGAGIGGGGGGAGGNITINSAAHVTATGGAGQNAAGGGAGIGSGGTNAAAPVSAGTITINPAMTTATITATGGVGAAPAGNGAAVGTGGYLNSNGMVSYVIPAGTAAVPTLGQWALMLLALLLGGAALGRRSRG